MKPKNFKAKEKGKIVAIVEQDLGSDSRDETKIIAMALKNLKGKEIVNEPISSISNYHIDAPSEEKRIELFHVRVISKHTKVDTLFDNGLQANLISEDLVNKLNLGPFHIQNHIHLVGFVRMQIYRFQRSACCTLQ